MNCNTEKSQGVVSKRGRWECIEERQEEGSVCMSRRLMILLKHLTNEGPLKEKELVRAVGRLTSVF